MSTFNLCMDKDSFISILIKNNRIDTVREIVVSDSFTTVFKRERLNYCSESELRYILEDERFFLNVLDEYALSPKMLDLIFESDYLNRSSKKAVIEQYFQKLKPNHVETMLNDRDYMDLIVKQDNLDPYTQIFLNNKGILKKLSLEALSIRSIESNKNVDIKSIDSIKRIVVSCYARKWSEEEVVVAVEKILALPEEFESQGYMDNLMNKQLIPDKYLMKMLIEWDYDGREEWFLKMLSYQKLDNIIDIIVDNVELTDEAVVQIFSNKNTATSTLARLYEKYESVVLSSKIVMLPILDIHKH